MGVVERGGRASSPSYMKVGSMNAVEVSGLRKSYGKIQALQGVDLHVPAGAIYGLVGPNGAGKTTLIKALVGALRPDAGEVRVLGLDPLKQKWALRRQIGYMPQAYALYEDLSARDHVTFYGQGQNTPDLARKVDEILAFTELSERADDPVRTFSGGMKKRVSLACALIHDPAILFLDEPTAAVDPHLRQRSWQLFRALAGRGVTLLISTHLMEEALLCDQVTIVRQGQIVAMDTPERLLERGQSRLWLQQNGAVQQQWIPSTPAALAAALHAYGLAPEVDAVSVRPESLEEIVLDIIQQQEAQP